MSITPPPAISLAWTLTHGVLGIVIAYGLILAALLAGRAWDRGSRTSFWALLKLSVGFVIVGMLILADPLAVLLAVGMAFWMGRVGVNSQDSARHERGARVRS